MKTGIEYPKYLSLLHIKKDSIVLNVNQKDVKIGQENVPGPNKNGIQKDQINTDNSSSKYIKKKNITFNEDNPTKDLLAVNI